ncbi:hypothetical protein KVH15_33370 [Streptomyces olivaceus]|uniref:hypothetical protein n=1 Tax=Streptomyces olivaceus TaxID=47716 RepID=UPI001CCC1E91|nr:hypothetical protein [Streptomyces olivaceus]MBZ6085875.1 hypothetical protein [Streptomyces olivaceus]
MSQFAVALGAAAATVGAGTTLIVRALPITVGRADPTELPPVDALHRTKARCPVQARVTPHVRLAMGGVFCTECHHVRLGGAA